MENKINENEKLGRIIEHCLLALNCPRGRYYPDKNFGSTLKEYADGITMDIALDCARQAVREIDGVLIKSAEPCENGILFRVLVNNEEGQVTVNFEQNN